MRVPAVWAALWAIFWCLWSRPVAAQSTGYDCDAFFEEVGDAWGLLSRVQSNYSGDLQTDIADLAQDAEDADATDGMLLAVLIPDDAELRLPDAVSVEHPVAICSIDPFYPPPIVVRSTATETGMLAMANAIWDDPEQSTEEQGRNSFILSGGKGLILQDVSFVSGAIDGSLPHDLMRLRDSSGETIIQRLTITGQTENLTIVRHESLDTTEEFRGTYRLEDLDWSGIANGSSLFSAACVASDGSGDEQECSTSTVANSNVQISHATISNDPGSASGLPALVDVKGEATLSHVTFQDLGFGDNVAIEASGALKLDLGTALTNLEGTGEHPLLKSRGSDLHVDQTVIAHVFGWSSLLKAPHNHWVQLRESYVCEITETDALVETFYNGNAKVEVISTALVGSRFRKALVTTEASSLDLFLANLLLLNVQNPNESGNDYRLDLVRAPAIAPDSADVRPQLFNLLVSDSLFFRGDVDFGTAAEIEAVRIWHREGTESCSVSGVDTGDCETLDQAPEFTADDTLSHSEPPTCGIPIEALVDGMRVEVNIDSALDAGAEPDPDDLEGRRRMRETYKLQLPMLYADQLELVDAGATWESDDGTCRSNNEAEEPADIGAYGGTCSLSFLAPYERSSSGDTGHGSDTASDTGTPTADDSDSDDNPDAGATPSTVRFGLGAGCRYSAAALLLPLGFLARRRRRSTPA